MNVKISSEASLRKEKFCTFAKKKYASKDLS